jgi:serine/threonine-protein kinase
LTLDSRLSAALADRYRLERELGAGGMATVYLAQDLRHDRKVAIKVLRPELSAVIGTERFLREIKTIANLQHPHILGLIDSGEVNGAAYYVMPFVEGESLRDRLTREKQLAVPDAVRLARETADALDYAHRHGVIHRDIKPENILLHDGRALVADFGIALAVSSAGGSSRMTETGMSLGTPHYMAPEQAMGEREITARADVYALGCVAYEMLVGEPPFTGPTAQAIIARVMTEEPRSLTLQRKTIPPHVEAAVVTALSKLPADRFTTAGEFAKALGDTTFQGTGFGPHGTVALRAGRGSRIPSRALQICVGAGVILAGLAAWGWLRPTPTPPVVRYAMASQPGQEMRQGIAGINVAISPDGRWLAYIGPGAAANQLYLRARDRLDATPIPGSEGATNPYFSPDGTRLAFHSGANFSLTVVPVAGGPPIQLDKGSPGSGGGGVWGPDGYIYFDTPLGTARIRADGGTPELLIPLDSAKHEIGFAWTEALPNGKGLVFRARRNLDPNDFDIDAYDLKTRARHFLTKGVIARYVAPGYLVVLRGDGALLAAPFDQERLQLTGPMVPILSGVMVKPLGSADIAISRTGTLLYVPGSPGNLAGFADLVTLDRSGHLEPFTPPVTFNPGTNRGISISPDGHRIALDQLGTASPDIWVKTLPAGALTRLTFDSVGAFRPQWSADGKYVNYISQGSGSGRAEVWRIRGDGGAPPERVWADPHWNILAFSISRDGQWLVYRVTVAGSSRDIYGVHLGHDSVPTPLLTAQYWEDAPALSPDGHWLAYTSAESSRDEVFVRPFPNVKDGRWQVSTNGGSAPLWSRDGKELFFEDANVNLLAVPVRTSPTFVPGTPSKIADATAGLAGSVVIPYYDQMPDGRRFLAVRLGAATQGGSATLPIVADNWTTELLAKMKAH